MRRTRSYGVVAPRGHVGDRGRGSAGRAPAAPCTAAAPGCRPAAAAAAASSAAGGRGSLGDHRVVRPAVVTPRPKTVPVAGSKRQSSPWSPSIRTDERGGQAPAGTGRRARGRWMRGRSPCGPARRGGSGASRSFADDGLLAVEVAQRPAGVGVVLVQGRPRAGSRGRRPRCPCAAGRSGCGQGQLAGQLGDRVQRRAGGRRRYRRRRARWPATPRRGWGRRRRRPAPATSAAAPIRSAATAPVPSRAASRAPAAGWPSRPAGAGRPRAAAPARRRARRARRARCRR